MVLAFSPVAVGQRLLQAGILRAHAVQLVAHGVQLFVVIHRAHHGLAALPTALLELVGQSDGSGEHAFSAASALFAVQAVTHQRAAQVEVQVERRAEAEGVQDTEVAGNLGALRLVRHLVLYCPR